MEVKYNIKKEGNLITWESPIIGTQNPDFKLQLYFDKLGLWLNYIYLAEELRKGGTAAKLFANAQKEYGTIFISIADKKWHVWSEPNDIRHVEPPDGIRFVKNLLHYEIITSSQFQNPFPNEQMYLVEMNFPFLFSK